MGLNKKLFSPKIIAINGKQPQSFVLSSTTKREEPPSKDASVESDVFIGDLWWSVGERGPTPNILPRLVTIVQIESNPGGRTLPLTYPP